jgi:hypothetical protein
MLRSMSASHPHIGQDIVEQGRITAETETELKTALDTFNLAWN